MQLQEATRSNNISAIVSLIVELSKRTPEDIVNDALGPLMFVYYWFLKSYKHEPRDMDDLVDGLLFLDTKHYLEEQKTK